VSETEEECERPINLDYIWYIRLLHDSNLLEQGFEIPLKVSTWYYLFGSTIYRGIDINTLDLSNGKRIQTIEHKLDGQFFFFVERSKVYW
jgi:hypothetical protein